MKLHTTFVLFASLGLSAGAMAQNSFSQISPQGAVQEQSAYPQGQAGYQGQGAYPGSSQGNAYPGSYQGGNAYQGAYPQGQPGSYPQAPAVMPDQGMGNMPGGMPGMSGAQPMPGQGMTGGGTNAPQMQQLQQQIQRLVQAEMQDYGVPPQGELKTGEMHAPTPASIPGGQLITTDRLLNLYQQHQQQQGGLLVFDVLGSGQSLPMAQNALGAAQPGSFSDQVQQQFGQYLQQVTQGNTQLPLVFYCQGTYCWMSYNAALRAINLGYRQVYWYRGGVEAWYQMQQLAMSMQGQMPQQNPMMQPGQMPGGMGGYQ